MVLESYHARMWSVDVSLWKIDPKDQQGRTDKPNFTEHFLLPVSGKLEYLVDSNNKKNQDYENKAPSFIHKTMD